MPNILADLSQNSAEKIPALSIDRRLNILAQRSGLTSAERSIVAQVRAWVNDSKPVPPRWKQAIDLIWQKHGGDKPRRCQPQSAPFAWLHAQRLREKASRDRIQAEIKQLQAELCAAPTPADADAISDLTLQAFSDLKAVELNLCCIDRLIALVE